MNTKTFFAIIATVIFLPFLSHGQNNEEASPYTLTVLPGWRVERIPFPIDFAPQLKYEGVEELRFAPGWDDVNSEEHWSYSFLWWLKGKPEIDAKILQSNLTDYYSGLVARNITKRNIPADKVVPTTAKIKKVKTASNDLETYEGTVSMLDYHTQKPMVLNCKIHVKDSKTPNNTAIYFELSPTPFSHSIWKKLNETGDSFSLKK